MNAVKVHKCEIFDYSDFQVSMGKGMTLWLKKLFFKNIQGFIQGHEIPEEYAQQNFKEDFFRVWAKKIFFGGAFEAISQCLYFLVELLRPFLSVNNNFFKYTDACTQCMYEI